MGDEVFFRAAQTNPKVAKILNKICPGFEKIRLRNDCIIIATRPVDEDAVHAVFFENEAPVFLAGISDIETKQLSDRDIAVTSFTAHCEVIRLEASLTFWRENNSHHDAIAEVFRDGKWVEFWHGDIMRPLPKG